MRHRLPEEGNRLKRLSRYCHFLPISELVIENADYLNWDAFAPALARRIAAHHSQRLMYLGHPRQIAA